MGKATEKQIAFATVIAERLDLEEELEWILRQDDSFTEVSDFINENLEEYNIARREDKEWLFI